MSQHLNIVAFDVPYPANYGGVIDVYYKLYWLKKADVKVILHCFTYGRKPAKELEVLCEKVYYYQRKTGFLANLSFLPYNVKSRQSRDLAFNLKKNNYPILFEVLHTCWLMADPDFKNRKKIYRHSNIEHDYFSGLARAETNVFKKVYLHIEAFKLKNFEKVIKHADLILAVNQIDQNYFQIKYPKVPAYFLPSFHQEEGFNRISKRGDYCLFHGNLSVAENNEAVCWLIKHVFSQVNQRVLIAGLNPENNLIRLIQNYPHIALIQNPDEEKMDQLIREARLHVLYTSQATGLKLKLLNVLFKGRFVLCNLALIEGTGIVPDNSLLLAEKADDYIKKIPELMQADFTEEMRVERNKRLLLFDNLDNVTKLKTLIFN